MENGDNNYKWVVKSAGNAKLFMSGGSKRDPKGFLEDVEEFFAVHQAKKDHRQALEEFIIKYTPGARDSELLQKTIHATNTAELEKQMLPLAKRFAYPNAGNETVAEEKTEAA